MRFFYGGNMSKLTKNQIEINEDAIKMASDNTWYFYYKFLEDDYTISFKKYGDFSSKEQAKKKYVRVVSEYRKQIDNVKNSVHIEYTLKSYLSYWLYEIQFPKVAPRRQCVLDYVVNHIILLSIEEDILLDKITPSYLNELFSRCKKYSQTSGWMAQSVMSTLLKTAVEDQYLHNNPMDAVIRFPRNIPNYHVVPYDKMTSFLKNAKKYADAANTSDGVYLEILLGLLCGLRLGDDDDKIRLNQRKPSKYKGLRRFGPEKNLQRINKFMKERPIFYKNLIQMKENFRFYLRCFYCITKVVILQFNSENRTELARNG